MPYFHLISTNVERFNCVLMELNGMQLIWSLRSRGRRLLQCVCWFRWSAEIQRGKHQDTVNVSAGRHRWSAEMCPGIFWSAPWNGKYDHSFSVTTICRNNSINVMLHAQ